MLIELCVGNYATSNNLVNEIYDIFIRLVHHTIIN